MTDRPPTLILKPRAQTIAHPTARSPCVVSPLSPLSSTISPRPHDIQKPIALARVAPIVQSESIDSNLTKEQIEERELTLKLTTLKFVEEELLVSEININNTNVFCIELYNEYININILI